MRAGAIGVGLLAVVLAGCGGAADRPRPPPRLESPNGEPLQGAADLAGCRAAQADWLRRADRNGDGRLDEGEFRADAARWFAVIDTGGQGVVTAVELAQVRQRMGVVAPPVPAPARRPPDRSERGRGLYLPTDVGAGRSSMERSDRIRAAAEPPDPVMEADTNLDFRVTRAEYDALTARRFALLSQGRGLITAEDAAKTCREE